MTYEVRDNLLYTKEHEWAEIIDGEAKIGITDYAQKSLGDITYLEISVEVGDEVERGQVLGVVESVKATSDIYAPLSGKVIEINQEVIDSPEIINEDPYGKGWILRLEIKDEEEKNKLLSPKEYSDIIKED
ncbi:MAG TPA: glycine cleavage system protein GcvH [Euryarchaeota archaeon]|nr:MAG: glycine cleavage system protein GcvH [Thermococci archaeon]RLF97258.1 MAG: glycine cleavage system protein GcvH [Thermococci archaeon]HDI10553.1 glycine cleavage system protein GcvH [Euryarchaeota archaeon]